MRFCSTCGKEVYDQAVICPNCGCPLKQPKPMEDGETDGLATAAKVFLIIGCIAQGVFLIPLAWCLPITISICTRMSERRPVGTGLKICSLLFVNLVAGILLLCRSDD